MQEVAAALEAGIRLAPEQWCVFKPIWPDDPGEAAGLESTAGTPLEMAVTPIAVATPKPAPPGVTA
jgi:hypothetical protein